MSNRLRLIFDNQADYATLSTSTTAGNLVANNMLTDRKTQVWRATTTSGTITANWASAKLISGIVLPFTNLSSAATIRVRGYFVIGDTTPAFDTGVIYACPAPAFGMWNWGDAMLGANAFSYGGGSYARAWLATPIAVAQLVIDIVDVSNTAGYIEVGKLVAGKWWSPEINTDVSDTVISVEDSTTQFRNDAGDLLSDNGVRFRKQTISFPSMPVEDRQQIWNILRANGLSRPMLLSVYPDSSDVRLEQMHMMYCKLVETPEMKIPYFARYSTSFTLEEI